MKAQLRPVSEVIYDLEKESEVINYNLWYANPTKIHAAITTDRDTAYTMLREQMVKKSCDELVIPDYIKQGGFSHEVVFKEGYNAAINTLLTLLDHIYGKTDALTK